MENSTSQKARKTAHHHGDLREALVQAGIELLAEHGTAGLTLRRCAARAGVSHAAPAHHFEGLDGLLTSIAARGYCLFTELMIRERAQSDSDPRQQLLAICRGYLSFAENNRSLYNLMFSSERVSYCDSHLDEASSKAYQVLADGCAPFKHGPDGAAGTEIMIWSLLHGFAGLSQKARQGGHRHPMADIGLEAIIPHLELADC